MKKGKIVFFTGVLLYFISFFLPAIQFSLGVELLGWESVLIQWSEILVVSSSVSYFKYLFIALSNFWMIGLIIGGITNEQKFIKIVLSILAITTSLSWLFLFMDNAVILYGYYVWLISVLLIIIGRFLKK